MRVKVLRLTRYILLPYGTYSAESIQLGVPSYLILVDFKFSKRVLQCVTTFHDGSFSHFISAVWHAFVNMNEYILVY